MAAKMSQKEYLQKYLSGGSKGTKKKKKRPKVIGSGMKIIDDDVDVSKMRDLEENELEMFIDTEDAPQIAGIIDDRNDPSKFNAYIRSEKWKVLGQDDGIDSTITVEKVLSKTEENIDSSPRRGKNNIKAKGKNDSDSDLSPPRRKLNIKDHIEKKRKKHDSDSDLSPPRTKPKSEDRNNHSRHEQRKRKNGSDSDLSPPRNKSINKGVSKRKNDSDSDLSPPRKKSSSKNDSKRKNGSDSDLSPPRTKSSTRKISKRKNDSDSDLSPVRNSSKSNREGQRKSRWEKERSMSPKNNHAKGGKMEKTLDGKKAGLQDARQLKDENDAFRRREDEMFNKMSSDVSGRNAEAVKRDIRKGGKKNTEAELAAEKEREERQKVLDAKYNKWGKGLKQLREHEEKVKEFIHEAAKPLARYKDDEDLDKHLRDVERLEDPMLEYMRKKKKNNTNDDVEAPTETYPMYNGAYPMNRFNIRPGYRWDGVDRSNGYEKSYFTMKNSRTANEEMVYKWSTEDM